MKKTVAALTVTGMILSVVWLFSSNSQGIRAETLRLLYPEISPIQDTVRLQGNVIAASKELIYAQGNSRVLELYISEGDQVSAGQCLMKLEQTAITSADQTAAAAMMYQLQDAMETGDLKGAAEILHTVNVGNITADSDCKEYYLYSESNGIVMKIAAQTGESVNSVLH